MKFKGDPGRTRVLPSEREALEALRVADRANRLQVGVDVKLLNRPSSPVYSEIDVFAVPIVLWTTGITLLLSWGMLPWVIDMAFVLVWQVAGQPRLIAWRLRERVRRLMLVGPENFRVLWKLGGITLALKDQPDRICAAPAGDIRLFAADNLIEPGAPEPAPAPAAG